MTPSQKLLARIDRELVSVPAGTVIERTYAGRLQRQAGAFSWIAITPTHQVIFGGYMPVGDLLSAKKITHYKQPPAHFYLDNYIEAI